MNFNKSKYSFKYTRNKIQNVKMIHYTKSPFREQNVTFDFTKKGHTRPNAYLVLEKDTMRSFFKC